MLRWTFNILTVVSLLLCVASVVLWARSGTTSDQLMNASYEPPTTTIFLIWAHDGSLAVAHHEIDDQNIWQVPLGWSVHAVRVQFSFDSANEDFITDETTVFSENYCRYFRGTVYTPQRNRFWLLVFPFWFLTLVTSGLPLFWFLAYCDRRRRLAVGRCFSCGYDLRASGDTCPECGATRRDSAE